MDLDERVSGVLFRMHKLERALHEGGQWTIVWRGRPYQAFRQVSQRGVTFVATLSGGEALPSEAWLNLEGQPFEYLTFTPPPDGQPFKVEVAIEVEDSVAA